MRRGRRLRWIVCVAVASAACGSFQGADPDPVITPPLSDGSVPAEGATDASTPTPEAAIDAGKPCAPDGLFTSVHKVDGLNSAGADSYARFSADERVAYFQRAAPAGISAIFRAERPTRQSAFGTPVAVQGLFGDGRFPFVTADELTIYYCGATGSQFDPYIAHRSDASAPFEMWTKLSLSAANTDRVQPFLRTDGKEIFFSSGPVAADNYNLWHAFPVDGGFADAGPLDELNSVVDDEDPVISGDGLELYFYSARNAPQNGIWHSHRDSLTELFRSPKPVSELTPETGYVSASYISNDLCRLYFHGTQDPATGLDIYVAERSP